MCDWDSQHYKRQLSIIDSSGEDGKACIILPLTRSTRVRIHLLANFFFSLFKFQITSEKHLFLIKMKEIIKVENKVSGWVRCSEGFIDPIRWHPFNNLNSN